MAGTERMNKAATAFEQACAAQFQSMEQELANSLGVVMQRWDSKFSKLHTDVASVMAVGLKNMQQHLANQEQELAQMAAAAAESGAADAVTDVFNHHKALAAEFSQTKSAFLGELDRLRKDSSAALVEVKSLLLGSLQETAHKSLSSAQHEMKTLAAELQQSKALAASTDRLLAQAIQQIKSLEQAHVQQLTELRQTSFASIKSLGNAHAKQLAALRQEQQRLEKSVMVLYQGMDDLRSSTVSLVGDMLKNMPAPQVVVADNAFQVTATMPLRKSITEKSIVYDESGRPATIVERIQDVE